MLFTLCIMIKIEKDSERKRYTGHSCSLMIRGQTGNRRNNHAGDGILME